MTRSLGSISPVQMSRERRTERCPSTFAARIYARHTIMLICRAATFTEPPDNIQISLVKES